MNDLVKKLIAGAVSGLLAAVVVDVHAWAKSSEAFNWGLAVKRWVAGAVSGATGALGMGAIS